MKKNTELTVQVEPPDDDQILQMFLKISEKIGELAEAVRAKIKADPEWPEKFAEKNAGAGITASGLLRIASVGIKVIPQLYFVSSAGAAALKRLPLELQEQYASEPVQVLAEDGSALAVEVNNLQPQQVRQVFAADHVRSLPEQKAWLESEKLRASRVPTHPAMGYRIAKGRLIVGDLEFTAKELATILAQL